MMQNALEGTWEEIRAHDAALAGRHVRLTFLDADQPTDFEGHPDLYPLQGMTPYSYPDPFEPAIPLSGRES
jgi:hypothetical protein